MLAGGAEAAMTPLCFAVSTALASCTEITMQVCAIINTHFTFLLLACLQGFAAMRAMVTTFNDVPEKASRPFDKRRGGFVMGEGSGVVLMETLEHAKARGADILCEVVGYGATCDANHITAPLEDGSGLGKAMQVRVVTFTRLVEGWLFLPALVQNDQTRCLVFRPNCTTWLSLLQDGHEACKYEARGL